MDFGLARQVDGSAQSSMMGIAGTPGYMSPEQARGELQLDRRADVYGLGATLYSVLCGQPPFSGSPTEVLLDVLSKAPRSLRVHDRTLPTELDTLVRKCLEKEPEHRYPSAKALADDLERYLAGRHILARPPPLRQRMRKLARGHKLLLVSALGVLVALGILGAEALRARLQAEQQARLAQRLGQEIAKMEWFLRSARQIPLHSPSREKQIVRTRMQRLQTELATDGGAGRGLAHYALGRGHLALHEYPQALAELQHAVQQGVKSPELDYAIGLTLGRHFEQSLHEARLSGGGDWVQRQLKELEPRYLLPAIHALQRSRTAQLEAPEYLEALLSFYQRDYGAALQHAAAVFAEAPWMYEAAKLTGDVHHELALRSRDRGLYEEAQQQFAAAVRSYEAAAATGPSDAEVYEALAETWVRQIEMLAARGLPTETAYTAAVAVSDRLTQAEPQSPAGLLKKAFAAMLSLSVSGAGPAPQPRIQKCLEAAEAVLKQEPGNPYASEVAASCYARAAERALAQGADPEPLWRQASAVLEVALRRAPRFLWGLNDLGNIYVIRGAYRAQHGNPAARADLERALQLYQAATALDEGYLIGWQNTLGCLDELVLLTDKPEQERHLVPLVEEVFARCQALNSQYPLCHDNYAIFYVRLARLRALASEEHRAYLERARARFTDLQRLGGRYLDAEQHLALLHLLDASAAVRAHHDPAPAQAALQAALGRCFVLADKDLQCQTLAAQADWVEADRLAHLGKPPLHTLSSALRKARLAVRNPQQHPDAWWTLAATHLRLARALGHRPMQRDRHVREGLLASQRALSLQPDHGPSRQVQQELRLLSVPAQF